MLTIEYRNIINDIIKYELSYNLRKAQDVSFIVYVRTCTGREKVADLYESFLL